MHTNLKIVGCGGHLRVVIDALFLGEHKYRISLCDGNKELLNTEICGITVDSTMESLPEYTGFVHITIGNNQIRENIYSVIKCNATPLTIIHPRSVISKSSVLGRGTFVAAQAILGPESTIGEGCIINHGAVVDHEVRIGAYSHIAPNSTLGGNVTIGKGVLVGAGAVVLPGVRVGNNAIIAAGAVVIKDVESHRTVKGVPAV